MSEPGWSPQSLPDSSEAGTGRGLRRRPEDLMAHVMAAAGLVVAFWVASLLAPSAFPQEVILVGAVLGTGTGLMAVGLVLTYRTTRIVNFAYGAMGGFCALVAVALNQGTVEVGGWDIDLGGNEWTVPGPVFEVGNLPWLAVVPIGIGLGAVVGASVERLVVRRFVRAPRLVLTVATIGLAQVFAAGMLFLPGWFGLPVTVPSVETPLSDSHLSVGTRLFNGNDFLLLAVVPLVLLGLTLFLRMTESGVAVRGMAENMDRARLLGIPVNRLSLLLWSIAGALAATTSVLTAPNHGIPFELAAGPSLLLAPLTAAVVARMSSLSTAFVSGVFLGVLDQLMRFNYPEQRELSWLVYLAVIVVALLVQRRPASRAEQANETSWSAVGVATKLPRHLAALPEVRAMKVTGWVLLAVALASVPLLGSQAQIHEATIALTWGLAALSLVVLTGWGGVVSLGQVAFVGVGGMTAAHLIATRNTDLFLAIGASAVAGGVVALLVGLPALRVYGQYLAVTTLAFAVVMEQYVVVPTNHSGYFHGFLDRPELWGRFPLEDERWLYALALALVAATAAVIVNLRRARAGRAIAATRDNERGAAAVGINGIESRLAVFVVAGMLAGLAGAVHVMVVANIDYGTYPAVSSLLLFSMAVIGGVSSVGGVLAGVGLISWLGWMLPGERYQILLTGVGLLAILMVAPGGISQAYERGRDRFALAVARRRGVPATDATGDDSEAPVPVLAPETPPGGSRPARGAYGQPPPRRAEAPLLLCEGVESSYGAFQVLFGIDTQVGHGQMLALLGTNGAGKSTLLKSLSGLLPPDAGRVTFDGRDITNLPAEKVAKLGLSSMPGGRGVFPTLTVNENLRLAGWMTRRDRVTARAARSEVLELFPVLRRRGNQQAGDLSGGEQQQLSLAMALVTRPKLLCIDELSLGLAPSIVGSLVDKVKEVNQRGTAVVVVEQSVNVALMLCERAVFMEKGQVRFRGPTAGLLERPDVLRAVFLGETASSPGSGGGGLPGGPPASPSGVLLSPVTPPAGGRYVRARRTAADPSAPAAGPYAGPYAGPSVRPSAAPAGMPPALPAAQPARRPSRGVTLECEGLVKRFGGVRAVDRVNLVIPPASMVGLIGHNGAGKTTLFDVLTGFLPADGGTVRMGGRDITSSPPHRRAVRSLGRSFQEARLFPSLSVRDTLAVALETHLLSRDPLAAALRLPVSSRSERQAAARVDDLVELLGLGQYQERPTGELSTGTRRIVELGCLLAHGPSVVLLDEPSGGVAQREAEALGPLLRRVQAETGCSMVVIEHDMALISSLCDELVALEQGAVIASGPPESVLANDRVVSSYLGTEDKVVQRSGAGVAGFGNATPWRVQNPPPH